MVRIGVLILIGFENYSQEKELETETETGMVMTQVFWDYKQSSPQPVTVSLSCVYNRKPPNRLLLRLLCCQTLALPLTLPLFPFPPHHPNRYCNFHPNRYCNFDDDPTTCAIFQLLMEDSFI